jgi:hypothetical protein
MVVAVVAPPVSAAAPLLAAVNAPGVAPEVRAFPSAATF